MKTAAVMFGAGTRPEIIKISPIIRAFERKDVPFVFVHSGQHYDYNLSLQFIEELGLPKPDFDLKVRERSPGRQTGRILIGFEKAIKKFKPSILLVEGDTNSVLAAALAANKNNVALGHVEAGLRSFDLRMPEEHNRRLVDHISNYLFAPTSVAKENLIRENVWGAIYVTGNTVIDACIENLPLAEKKSNIMSIIDVKEYILATIHRSENVDNPEVLRNFIEAFEESPLPVVVPLHPRTVNRLKRLKLWTKIKKSCNVKVLPPVGYFDFLILMKNSRLIMTDSGGIQEEATAPPIRKFVLILRTSTERPEAIKAGFARITGVSKDRILLILKEALERKVLLPETSPFGDGMSGERITDIILGKILPRLK